VAALHHLVAQEHKINSIMLDAAAPQAADRIIANNAEYP
jgi:hypothetical protein